jgi:hypothetical protein
MSRIVKNVTDLLPVLQKVRESLGLSASRYPDSVVLAFVHYESKGDLNAVSPSGRHFGILQCMDAYVEDASVYAKKPKFPARTLLGDAEKSFWVFFNYMERYQSVHLYSPTMMAVLHKGGIGTATRVQKSSLPLEEAIAHVEKTFVNAKGNPFAPNLLKYVRDYRDTLQVYARWVDDLNKPFAVCDPQVLHFPTPGGQT